MNAPTTRGTPNSFSHIINETKETYLYKFTSKRKEVVQITSHTEDLFLYVRDSILIYLLSI